MGVILSKVCLCVTGLECGAGVTSVRQYEREAEFGLSFHVVFFGVFLVAGRRLDGVGVFFRHMSVFELSVFEVFPTPPQERGFWF